MPRNLHKHQTPAPPLFPLAAITPASPSSGTHSYDDPSLGTSDGLPSPLSNGPRPRSKSSRSVTELSAAQLQKKRVSDREAQRAIRERTKQKIAGLELRVQELEAERENEIETSQQLQAALREREDLYVENTELRKRINVILEIVDPVLPAHTAELVKGALGMNAIHDTSLGTPSLNPTCNKPNSRQSIADLLNSEDIIRSSVHSASRISSEKAQTVHHRSVVASRKPSPTSKIGPTKSSKILEDPSSNQNPYATPPHQYQSPHMPRPSLAEPSQQIPIYGPPTSYFDEMILVFIAECRRQASAGVPMEHILGPDYLELTGLVYPERRLSPKVLNISNLAICACDAFPAVLEAPERIAIIYCVYVTLRWIITQSAEHWHVLPEFLQPVPEQARVPHPVWMDYVPWPHMRAQLIPHQPPIHLTHFEPHYSSSLSVNCPLYNNNNNSNNNDDDDIWTCLYEDGNEIRIKSAFVSHISDLRNWTLGLEFAEALPTLAHTCRIRRA